MTAAPRGSRRAIGFLGRRNAGKSSLVNLLAGEAVSLVSPVPGTTADPVRRSLELRPLGPVELVDTAGLDDDDPGLGAARAEASARVAERVDMAVLVAEAGRWGAWEDRALADLRARGVPVVVALNKRDLAPDAVPPAALAEAAWLHTVADHPAHAAETAEALRHAIVRAAPDGWTEDPPLARDLLPPGGWALLVVPLDQSAPKGRLILPQAQVLRDLLDGGHHAVACRDTELASALAGLERTPDLVITDSQAFAAVAKAVPSPTPLTGFSVLLARAKGDLAAFAAGAAALARLRPGDAALVAESCVHHATGDDIGRVKIPRLLERLAGGPLDIRNARGRDFPEHLAAFRAIVQCGGCMDTRRAMLARQDRAARAGVPMANYGMALAQGAGILERALSPFPEALEAWRNAVDS